MTARHDQSVTRHPSDPAGNAVKTYRHRTYNSKFPEWPPVICAGITEVPGRLGRARITKR